MQIPNCSLLHDGGYINFECMKLVETADELRVVPAFPSRDLGIACGFIMALAVGMCAVVWYAGKQNPVLSLGLALGLIFGFGTLVASLVFCLAWLKFRRESKRGVVFIVNKNEKTYSFPRKAITGGQSDLIGVILVEGQVPGSEDRILELVELQIILKRNGDPPTSMLLVHTLGFGRLPRMQEQLASCLHLPALRTRIFPGVPWSGNQQRKGSAGV